MEKIIKDDELNIKFSDYEYLEDMLSVYGIKPEELCYQLTAYENDGIIDYETGLNEILKDYINEPTESEFYDYLDENYYEYVYDIDMFDEVMSRYSPLEIAEKCFYGHNFNPGSNKYFRLNAYDNVDGYEDFDEVLEDYPEFYDWYYERNLEDLFYDKDFKDDIIKGTLQLVEQGY